MLVKELIDELQKMPQDAKVSHLWDGSARTNIEHIWLSKSGDVVTSDFDMVCYYDGDRPTSAPTKVEQPYWRSPEDPNETE